MLLLFGFDKLQAKGGGRRVRESTLLWCCYLFGSIGALFGMVLFNHKTAKMKFRLLVPLAVALNVALLYGYIVFLA
ncbi:MAG: DUF1294 domain-containing protein [Clostridia bacterium]|nr:DUF1294 domain-containing protein [Clostridia bacterium]